MERYNIYKHIADRTQGDIYVGVVGPVRTGNQLSLKGSWIFWFLPNIDNEFKRERARDELPQSANGRTIMTTEPKFVPNEAVEITLNENIKFKVRMVDCVGYIVKGARGYLEENAPRMVNTPWFDEQIPFGQAAEIGTRKVINEHSTIGILVTTDGSITDIDREEYVEAEERVVRELKATNKPFVMILNSTNPDAEDTMQLRAELEEKYKIPVVSVDAMRMGIDNVNYIMEHILYEFPVCEVGINIPRWVEALSQDHWLRVDMINAIKECFRNVRKIREIKDSVGRFNYDFIKKAYIDRIDLGTGKSLVEINTPDRLFYSVLSELSGIEIEGEHRLITLIKELAAVKKEYSKVEYALHEVRTKGYGIIAPQMDELTLDEPEIVRQGNRFGVKLRASAPSVHMIRADIETEIAPLVGSEKQSAELVNYLLAEFEDNPEKLWESQIFGKSLHELIKEGLQNKLFKMPEDAQIKLQETLQRIINDGSSGLICIIL